MLLLNQSYSTEYTLYGQPVQVCNRSELSQTEISSSDYYFTHEFPSAQFVSSSSNTYNCHNYAWRGPTSSHYWLNANTIGGSLNSNISKFWTNDQYEYVSSSYLNGTDVVLYYSNDEIYEHSALVYDSTHLISKWGSGPVMIHTPTDCPYVTGVQGNKYYKEFPRPVIIGDDMVSRGDTETYYGDGAIIMTGVTYHWVVEEDHESVQIVNNPDGSITLTFSRRGIVQLYLETRWNGYYIHTSCKEILIEQ